MDTRQACPESAEYSRRQSSTYFVTVWALTSTYILVSLWITVADMQYRETPNL